MLLLTEAAAALGLTDPRHVRKCLTTAGVCPTPAPSDRRRRLITESDFEALRTARDALWPAGLPVRPAVAPPDARQSVIEALEQQSHLYARIEALERRVARLEAQRHALPAVPAVRPPMPPIPPRAAAAADLPDSAPDATDVPAGALPLGAFATLAGIPETTLRRWAHDGLVEVIRRASATRPGQLEHWLTTTGQQQARTRQRQRTASTTTG